MSPCDDYTVSAMLFFDGELTSEELVKFRLHLESCVACNAFLELEQSTTQLLRRTRPKITASDELRRRIFALVPGPFAADRSINDGSRRDPKAASAHPLWLRMGRAALRNWRPATALLLVLTLALLLLPPIERQARASAYVKTALLTHRDFLQGRLPPEIHSDSPDVVTSWFRGKVPFHFQLPSAQPHQIDEPTYRLTGARLVNFRGEYAALVTYDMQGKSISLLAVSSKVAEAWGGNEVQSGTIVFHSVNDGDLTVITWTNHDLTYALVSSFTGSPRQSCLVCHQNLNSPEVLRPGH